MYSGAAELKDTEVMLGRRISLSVVAFRIEDFVLIQSTKPMGASKFHLSAAVNSTCYLVFSVALGRHPSLFYMYVHSLRCEIIIKLISIQHETKVPSQQTQRLHHVHLFISNNKSVCGLPNKGFLQFTSILLLSPLSFHSLPC